MAHHYKYGAYAGAIAAASMAITPAYAADISTADGPIGTIGYATSVHTDFADGIFDSSTYDTQAEAAEWRSRRWRGRRGWRRGRVRGGDVLAGVLVLGGIAAIASAASNNNRRDRDRRYEERRDDRRYDDRQDNRRSNPRASGGSGIDSAVSQCLTEIERDVRVDSVDGASRLAEGWVVSGTLFNGSGFTCQIGNDGRISGIDYGGFTGSSYGEGNTRAEAAGQLSDDRYADARAAVGQQRPDQQLPAQSSAPAAIDDGPQPAYPGGPLPGETYAD